MNISMEIAKNVDFVISFWSSGAMDCNTLGVPVIEYFDPNQTFQTANF